MSITEVLLGRPIGNRESEARKLGILTGLPAMGLDGLGSAAYGPEAALTILAATGAAGLGATLHITAVILVLLAILFFSYWQTIAAYPNNGGSFVVAKENLGRYPGLLAAAALMIDYVLNVAVGISAGVGALTSAVPSLHQYTLYLCLGILAAITFTNLRGTRDTGLLWALPTYLFVATLGTVLATGLYATFVAAGHPHAVVAPPKLPAATAPLALWLLLRAFASGCTAMTGVEAVSNGVSAFKEPRVRTAHGTLAAIVIILSLLLLGIAYAAQSYGVTAMDQTKPGYQSVLSQLTQATYGRGWFYDVTIGSILAVLCLSANTSFVDFPRLCHLLAEDGFLPRPFALPGRRLVYSVGILFLAVGAGGLLAAFGGITDRLIPLFAVGAFLSFTLSQAGMAAHWRRERRPIKLAINFIGAIATGLALAIILAAKFLEGAWITVLVIPLAILLLRAIRRFYDDIDRQVLPHDHRRLSCHAAPAPIVLVPLRRWDLIARKAMDYAMSISHDITALHFVALEGPDAEERQQELRDAWHEDVEVPAHAAGRPAPSLHFLDSEYRTITAPLLRMVQEMRRRQPGARVTIVLPELIDGRWWGAIMYANRERRVRARLLRHAPGVVVASVPWTLQPAHTEAAIREEEPAKPAAKAPAAQ